MPHFYIIVASLNKQLKNGKLRSFDTLMKEGHDELATPQDKLVSTAEPTFQKEKLMYKIWYESVW